MKRKKISSKKRKNKSKKKIEEKKREELKLEEIKEIKKTEDEEEFFEEPVRQISSSQEISAPILERIIQRETSAPSIEFNQELAEERGERRTDYSLNPNQLNYLPAARQEGEEKKYETDFVPPVLSRREISARELRQDFLKPQNEAQGNKTNEAWLNEVDFIEEERKLPFEEKQKKYKRFRLR